MSAYTGNISLSIASSPLNFGLSEQDTNCVLAYANDVFLPGGVGTYDTDYSLDIRLQIYVDDTGYSSYAFDHLYSDAIAEGYAQGYPDPNCKRIRADQSYENTSWGIHIEPGSWNMLLGYIDISLYITYGVQGDIWCSSNLNSTFKVGISRDPYSEPSVMSHVAADYKFALTALVGSSVFLYANSDASGATISEIQYTYNDQSGMPMTSSSYSSPLTIYEVAESGDAYVYGYLSDYISIQPDSTYDDQGYSSEYGTRMEYSYSETGQIYTIYPYTQIEIPLDTTIYLQAYIGKEFESSCIWYYKKDTDATWTELCTTECEWIDFPYKRKITTYAWTPAHNSSNEYYTLKAIASVKSVTIATKSDPDGAGKLSGAGTYKYGTTVTLTAVANDGYKFAYWEAESGATIEDNTNTSIKVSATDETYIAHFNKIATISVTMEPDGYATVFWDQTIDYAISDTVTVKTTVYNQTYEFDYWTFEGAELDSEGTINDNPITLTITDESVNIVAHLKMYEEPYKIEVNKSPEDCPCTAKVTTEHPWVEGQRLTLYAWDYKDGVTYDEEWQFDHWEDESGSTFESKTYSFTYNSAKTFTAVYTGRTHTISATVDPEGAGTVKGAKTYDYKEKATLTATSSDTSKYVFDAWYQNGSRISEDNPYIIDEVTDDATYVAHFKRYVTVTVASSNVSWGTAYINSEGTTTVTLLEGSSLTFVASEKTDYTFMMWEDATGELSTQKSYTTEVPVGSFTWSVLARFTQLRSINIAPSGAGAEYGTVSPTKITDYLYTYYTLRAYATGKAQFYRWQYLHYDEDAGKWVLTKLSDKNPYTDFYLDDTYANGDTIDALFDMYWTCTTSIDPSTPSDIAKIFPAPGEPDTVSQYDSGFGLYVLSVKPGWKFLGWYENDKLFSSEETVEFSATRNRNFVAKFEHVGDCDVDISWSPELGGNVTGATSGVYEYNSTVTLTAEANSGYQFSHWVYYKKDSSEYENISGKEHQFTIEENCSIVAIFKKYYTLTLGVEPTDCGTVSGGGYYVEGTSHTITASPASGYEFLYWTLDGEPAGDTKKLNITMPSADTTYVANFQKTLSVTKSVAPSGAGSITIRNGVAAYLPGAQITLDANVSSIAYKFSSWEYTMGGVTKTSTTSPLVVTLTDDLTVKAYFESNETPYTLYVTTSPVSLDGAAVITTIPEYTGSIAAVYANDYRDDASAYEYWTFSAWYNVDIETQEETLVANTKTYSFKFTENTHLKAVYKKRTCKVTAYASPTDGGTVTGGGDIEYNTQCNLKATNTYSYQFNHFTVGSEEIDTAGKGEYTFTVTSDTTCIAYFDRYVTVKVATNNTDLGSAYILYGDEHLEEITLKEGSTVQLVAENVTGCTFIGWYKDGVRIDKNDEYLYTVPNNQSEVTITAMFTKAITLYVKSDTEGCIVSPTSATVDYDSTLSLAVTEMPDNYVVKGWYYNNLLLPNSEGKQNYELTVTTDFVDSTVITAKFDRLYDVAIDVEAGTSESVCTVNGAGSYKLNTPVTATVSDIKVGYVFDGWYDENDKFITDSKTYVFNVTGDIKLKVKLHAEEYYISLDCDPDEGGTIKGLTSGSYPKGTEVRLEASSSANYIFTEWVIESASKTVTQESNSVYLFVVEESLNITAKFRYYEEAVVYTKVDPEDYGSVTGAGTYKTGDYVTLKATSSSSDYVFSHWTKSSDSSWQNDNEVYNFTASLNYDCYTAHFARVVKITTSAYIKDKYPTETVPVDIVYIDKKYMLGDSLTFFVPSTYYTSDYYVYTFDHLDIEYRTDYSPSLVPIKTETISKWSDSFYIMCDYINITINAYYSKDTYVSNYTITTNVSPQGKGKARVTSDPPYFSGNYATIEATELSDKWRFDYWLDEEGNRIEDATYTFKITGNKLFTAYFAESLYTISAEASPKEAGTITGAGDYSKGTEVTLVATAKEGYEYAGYWIDLDTGEQLNQGNEYTFTVTGSRNLQAVFKQKVNVKVVYAIYASEFGSAYIDQGDGTKYTSAVITAGQPVTFKADPETGCDFVGWYSDANHTSLLSDSGTWHTTAPDSGSEWTVYAYFVFFKTTYVSALPTEGGSVNPGLLQANLYTQQHVTASNNTGYRFVNWTYNNVEVYKYADWTFTYDTTFRTGTNLYANFIKTYTVSLSADPERVMTIRGANTYDIGTEITISCTVNDSSYEFDGWYLEDGTKTDYEQSFKYTVNSDLTLIAKAHQVSYLVTIKSEPTEGGGVTGATDGYYARNTILELNPVANDGYKFVGWNKTAPDNRFTITEDTTIIAYFYPLHHVGVTVSPDGSGEVSFNPTGSGTDKQYYIEDDEVTLTAKANTSGDRPYEFRKWTKPDGSLISKYNPFTYTMLDTDVEFVANFEPSYKITTSISPTGAGYTKDTEQWKLYGDLVTVSAYEYIDYFDDSGKAVSESTGYKFRYFLINGEPVYATRKGAENTLQFTVTNDTEVIAYYEEVNCDVSINVIPEDKGNYISFQGHEVYDNEIFTVKYNSLVPITPTSVKGYSFLSFSFTNNILTSYGDNNYISTRLIADDVKYADVYAEFNISHTVTVKQSTGGSVYGAGTYAEGAYVKLTFRSELDYKLDGFYINDTYISSDSDDITISYGSFYVEYVYQINGLTEDVTIIPDFVYTMCAINVEAMPSAAANVSGTGSYGYNRELTLSYELTGKGDYKFSGWYSSGELVGDKDTYTFRVLEPKTFIAMFDAYYNIDVDIETISVETSVGGYVTGDGSHKSGSTVNLVATPYSGYYFKGWYDENDIFITKSSTYTIENLRGAVKLKAVFGSRVLITALPKPTDAGEASGTDFYNPGAIAALKATEGLGSLFKYWEENDSPVAYTAEFNYTVGETDTTLYAFFETGVQYNFKVVNDNPELGSVTEIDGKFDRNSTLGVIAFEGDNKLDGWYINGEMVSDHQLFSIKLIADTEVHVKFKKACSVKLSKNIEDAGTITGYGKYAYGDYVTIKATTTKKGCVFKGWYNEAGTQVYSEASVSFTILDNVSLIATYEGDIIYKVVAKTNPVEAASNCKINPANPKAGEQFTITFSLYDSYKPVKWHIKDGAIDSATTQLTMTANESLADDGVINIILDCELQKTLHVHITSDNLNCGSLYYTPGWDTTIGNEYYAYCVPGSTVTVVANIFSNCHAEWSWSNSEGVKTTSTNGSITFDVAMTEDRTLSIGFWPIQEGGQSGAGDNPQKFYVHTAINDSSMGSISEYNGQYAYGTKLKFTAAPNKGYKFIKWVASSGDKRFDCWSSSDNTTIVVDSDIDIVAIFVKEDKKCVLTAISDPDNVYTFQGTYPATYSAGENVSIQASCLDEYLTQKYKTEAYLDTDIIPNSNFSNLCANFTIFEDSVCTYKLKEYFTFKISSADEKLGTVESSVTDDSVLSGTEVTIKATCANGFTDFVAWVNENGETISEDKEYTFTVTDNVNYIATFEDNGSSPVFVYRDAEYRRQTVGLIHEEHEHQNINKTVYLCGQLFMQPGSEDLTIYDSPFCVGGIPKGNVIGSLKAPKTITEGSALFYNVIQLDKTLEDYTLIEDTVENEITVTEQNTYKLSYCSPSYQIDANTGEKYIWLCIYMVYDCDTQQFNYGWVRYVDNKYTDTSKNYYIFLSAIRTSFDYTAAQAGNYMASGYLTADSGPVNWNKLNGCTTHKLYLTSDTPCITCREEKRWYTTRGYTGQDPLYVSNNNGDNKFDCLSDTGISCFVKDDKDDRNHYEELFKTRFESTLKPGYYDIYDYCTGLQVVNGQYHVGVFVALRYNYGIDSSIFTHGETFATEQSGKWTDERSSETYDITKYGDYNHTDIDVTFSTDGNSYTCKYKQSPNALYDFTDQTRSMQYINADGELDAVVTVDNRRKSHCNNQNFVIVFLDTYKYGLSIFTNSIAKGTRIGTYNHQLNTSYTDSDVKLYINRYRSMSNSTASYFAYSEEDGDDINGSYKAEELDIDGYSLLLSPVYTQMGHIVYTNDFMVASEVAPIDAFGSDSLLDYVNGNDGQTCGNDLRYKTNATSRSHFRDYIINENDTHYVRYKDIDDTRTAYRNWAVMGSEVNTCKNIQFLEVTTKGYGLYYCYDNLIDFDDQKGQNYEPIVWRPYYIDSCSKDGTRQINEFWTQYYNSANTTIFNDICDVVTPIYELSEYTNIGTNITSVVCATAFTMLIRSSNSSYFVDRNYQYEDIYPIIGQNYYNHYIKGSAIKPLSWENIGVITESYRYTRGANYSVTSSANGLNIINSKFVPGFILNIDYLASREKDCNVTISFTVNDTSNVTNYFLHNGIWLATYYMGNYFSNGENIQLKSSRYDSTEYFKRWTINSATVSTTSEYTHTVNSDYGSRYIIYAVYTMPENNTVVDTSDSNSGSAEVDWSNDVVPGSVDEESGKTNPQKVDFDDGNTDDDSSSSSSAKQARYLVYGPYYNQEHERQYKMFIILYDLDTKEAISEFWCYDESYTLDTYYYSAYIKPYWQTKSGWDVSSVSIKGETTSSNEEYITNNMLVTMGISRDGDGNIDNGKFYNENCRYQYIFAYYTDGQWHEDETIWPGDFGYEPEKTDTEIVQKLELKDKITQIITNNFTDHNYLKCKVIIKPIYNDSLQYDKLDYTKFEFNALVPTTYKENDTTHIFRPDVRPENYELYNKGMYAVYDTLYNHKYAIAGTTKIYGSYYIKSVVENNTNDVYTNYLGMHDIAVNYYPESLNSKNYITKYDTQLNSTTGINYYTGALGGGYTANDAVLIPYISREDMGSQRVLFYADVTASDIAYDGLSKRSTSNMKFPYNYSEKQYGMYVYSWDAPYVSDVHSIRTSPTGVPMNALATNKNIKLTFKITYTPIENENYVDIGNIQVWCNGIDWASRLTVDEKGVYSIIIGNDDIDPFTPYSLLINIKDDVMVSFNKSYAQSSYTAECLMPLSLIQGDDNSSGVSFGAVATEVQKVNFALNTDFITDARITVSTTNKDSKGNISVDSTRINAYNFISRSGERVVTADIVDNDAENNTYIDNFRLTNKSEYDKLTSSEKSLKEHSLFISTELVEGVS